MVTMITLHILSAENREHGMYVLTKNMELTRKAKGYVSRSTYFSVDDPLKGYSVTTWETREDLENFRVSPLRPPLGGEGEGGAVDLITPDGPVLAFTLVDSGVFEELAGPD